jgi:phospholipid N-methyltransferase
MHATTTHTDDDTNAAGFPPAPSEAHQRADQEIAERRCTGMSATYSPEDNKLRLSSYRRLDPELFARVKAAGFRWAPRQEVFVAPMWTPGREDLLIELCGEIGDEDTTLMERAEDRADRFEGYSQKRAADAQSAHAHVKQISGRFEFGQPILIGHHSERQARKDKERMDAGMRKAVKMWDTSAYWTERAEAAQRHARYKELPDVRYRRIKGLESDLRKQQKTVEQNEMFMRLWASEGLTQERACALADRDHVSVRVEGSSYESLYSRLTKGLMTPQEASERAIACHTRTNAWAGRWIAHYTNRIQYERAMLGEAGGIAADKFDIVVGGSVLVRREWLTVMRVTKKDGRIVSVSTNARFVRVRSIEEIDDYRAPTTEVAAAVAKALKQPKLCNYPGEGFLHMTSAEWKSTHNDYKGTRQLGQGAHRMREGTGRPDVRAAAAAAENLVLHRIRTVVRGGSLQPVYITDAKTVPAPTAPAAVETVQPSAPAIPAPTPELSSISARQVHVVPAKTEFDAMRDQLRKGGAEIVSAPQLFPTPVGLAARVISEADIQPGDTVLEPSAGTGALIGAIADHMGADPVSITAIEVNAKLSGMLGRNFPTMTVICEDFLSWNGKTSETDERVSFARIVMNPPFERASDIAHINHARSFLKPGGRLVAICANGPRQQAALRPLAEASGGFYEPLPADTFKQAGTGVNTALVVICG